MITQEIIVEFKKRYGGKYISRMIDVCGDDIVIDIACHSQQPILEGLSKF